MVFDLLSGIIGEESPTKQLDEIVPDYLIRVRDSTLGHVSETDQEELMNY